MISTIALSYGAPGLQGADILSIFGAVDRLGEFFFIFSVREIGPLITAIVMAGVTLWITYLFGARAYSRARAAFTSDESVPMSYGP